MVATGAAAAAFSGIAIAHQTMDDADNTYVFGVMDLVSGMEPTVQRSTLRVFAGAPVEVGFRAGWLPDGKSPALMPYFKSSTGAIYKSSMSVFNCENERWEHVSDNDAFAVEPYSGPYVAVAEVNDPSSPPIVDERGHTVSQAGNVVSEPMTLGLTPPWSIQILPSEGNGRAGLPSSVVQDGPCL